MIYVTDTPPYRVFELPPSPRIVWLLHIFGNAFAGVHGYDVGFSAD